MFGFDFFELVAVVTAFLGIGIGFFWGGLKSSGRNLNISGSMSPSFPSPPDNVDLKIEGLTSQILHADTIDLFKKVQKILDSLPPANIAFNVPKSMNLAEKKGIELVLDLKKTIPELREEIEGSDLKEGYKIKVNNSMLAELKGADFDITELSPSTQVISFIETTKWKWEIEPKSKGEKELRLTLSAIIHIKGEASPRVVRTFDREIIIKVTPLQNLQLFLKEYSLLWKIILLPVLGGVWFLLEHFGVLKYLGITE